MEELLQKILEEVSSVKEMVQNTNHQVAQFEKRLAKLEKLDSIEHRVEVNQIDLADLKEQMEKVEVYQRENIGEFYQFLKGTSIKVFNNELHTINQRLDSQLTRIAKSEEAIMMLGDKREDHVS